MNTLNNTIEKSGKPLTHQQLKAVAKVIELTKIQFDDYELTTDKGGYSIIFGSGAASLSFTEGNNEWQLNWYDKGEKHGKEGCVSFGDEFITGTRITPNPRSGKPSYLEYPQPTR